MSMPETADWDKSAGIERNDTKFRTLWATAHENCGIAHLYVKSYNVTQSVRTAMEFSQK
jgi:hypothetical protein